MKSKISDILKNTNVVYGGPKEVNQNVCSNCDRLKVKHSNDQRENCVRARYLKS